VILRSVRMRTGTFSPERISGRDLMTCMPGGPVTGFPAHRVRTPQRYRDARTPKTAVSASGVTAKFGLIALKIPAGNDALLRSRPIPRGGSPIGAVIRS